MQFLVDHKSPVELLAFGPGYWPSYMYSEGDDHYDVNRHIYPLFYYRRGTMTVAMRGGRQIAGAAAVPVDEEAEHEEILFWK